MTAPGFCRCGAVHPWQATWCFACDKPVLPQPSPAVVPTGTGWPLNPIGFNWEAEAAEREQYADVMAADLADQRRMDQSGLAGRSTPCREAATQAGTICTPRPTLGSDTQPDPYLDPLAAECDPPEYDPDDAEAQRIAETYADARAEMDQFGDMP